MTLFPGLRGGAWFAIASFGLAAFSACTSDDGSLFGTRSDPSGNDAGSGGETEPASGGASPKGGAAPVTGGSTSKGGASGTGGSSTAGGDGGADAAGGVSTGTGGMPGSGNASSGGSGGKSCTHGGKTYPSGTSFPSVDGCNTCLCMASGVVCTARACAEGGAPGMSCEDEMAKELAEVQACEKNEDCGVPIQGSSCGCTRDWVARKDADTSRVEELLATCWTGGSTCDCPEADGYVCKNQRCAWNYVGANACNDTPVKSVCLVGIPISSGDRLEAGMKLQLQARPEGCFSSSCTEAAVAACSVQTDGSTYTASVEFCLRDVTPQGGGCTADCAGGGFAQCESEAVLAEGKYTLAFGGKSLEFEVPSLIEPGEGCIQLDP